MVVGTCAGIPSRRKRKGAGVFGSPTGHPFFIVEGNQTKAPHRMSMQADGGRRAFKDRRKVKSTPYGGPVPAPRGLLLDRSGAGCTTLYTKHGDEMAGGARTANIGRP